jgi:hypothetical protein
MSTEDMRLAGLYIGKIGTTQAATDEESRAYQKFLRHQVEERESEGFQTAWARM